MIHKSLLISGLALALLPSAAKAQLQVNPGAPLYIGPGGVVSVLGGNVILLEDVTGTGQLILNGSTTQSIGGVAGKSVTPELVINNGADVTLSSILRLAGNLNFTNGKLIAGGNNLAFTSTGTASGYGQTQNRYVVTNGTGFCTKEGLASGAAFTFPIGRSTTANDYNQAVITNSAAATRDFNVQVKSYSESSPTEANIRTGIDRTWQIYSNTAGNATIALQNKSTEEGNRYVRDSAFVTQLLASGRWDSTTGMAATAPNYTQTRSTLMVPASAASMTSFFSKSNDGVNSLNPYIGVSPIVILQGAYNGTNMSTSLNTLGILQAQAATQPYNITPYNYNGNESVPAGFFTANPNIVDWVLVELRNSATPSTIVATRAAFLLNTGAVVDIDGKSPVSFHTPTPVTAGNYHVAVRHRNHLGIRTPAAQTFTQDDYVVYNFTTAQTQAFGSNPMVAVAGGKFAMWAGNTDGDAAVRNAAFPSDRAGVVAAVSSAPGNILSLPSFVVPNVYSRSDVDMDGSVRNAAFPSDLSLITGNVANHPANVLKLPSFTVNEQL